MMFRIFILILMVSAFTATDLEAQRGKAKAKAKAPAPPEDTGPPPMSVPQTYKYDRRARRDPFVNPTPKVVKSEEEAKPVVPPVEQRPPGLKGTLLNDIAITAVVTAKDPTQSVAMISAPGGKRYFAHTGDALFDAVIKEIRPDGVLFVQSVPGRSSNTPPREIERKVRRTR